LNRFLLPTLVAIPVLFSVLVAATHDFVPDTVFQGSSINGLRAIGSADWRADKGEITGTPKTPEGGWLLLDKSYQDVQFYTEFRCAGPCNAGLLLRAEKTPEAASKACMSPWAKATSILTRWS
jgi:hypothetical protein